MSVESVHKHVHHVYMLCPQRLEEGVKITLKLEL